MKTFISHAQTLTELLAKIVASDPLHAKWLNTLSYLENCGARKIAACEHPTMVKEEVLKHAAEEFRHAHYLKRQIERIYPEPLENYSLSKILGGFASLNYLKILDLKTSRYLKEQGFNAKGIKEGAYLLVTYAIELRADELYRIYDGVLKKGRSRITVKSILLEEKEHLREMEEGLLQFPSGFKHAEHICAFEGELFKRWLEAIVVRPA